MAATVADGKPSLLPELRNRRRARRLQDPLLQRTLATMAASALLQDNSSPPPADYKGSPSKPSVDPAMPVAPATRPPAVPTPVMPVSAPVPTKTAVAAPIAAASNEADPYGQGAPSLVAGSTLEGNVRTILEMGGAWDRDTVVHALRAAFNNLERAVEYLYSGVPEQAGAPATSQVLSASGQPADPVQAPMSQAQIAPSGPNAIPLELFPQASPTQTVVLNSVPEATMVLSSTSLANMSSDAVADSQVVSNNEVPSPPNSKKASHQTVARVKRRKISSDSASDSSPPPPVNNCAKCKSHKRRCPPGCVFAPVFHVDQQSEYELISKVFGVRCMEKLLENVSTHDDRLHVRSAMLYAAGVWETNPVRGTHGVVQRLEMEKAALEKQLALVSQQQHQPAAEPAGDDAPNAQA